MLGEYFWNRVVNRKEQARFNEYKLEKYVYVYHIRCSSIWSYDQSYLFPQFLCCFFVTNKHGIFLYLSHCNQENKSETKIIWPWAEALKKLVCFDVDAY